MDKQNFGKRLKTARKSKYLTGEKLSDICHINATYLRQIEAGVKVPSMFVFVSLCNALEVSPTYLLQDTICENELSSIPVLTELWEAAAPEQIGVVTAMICSALGQLARRYNI